MIGELVIGVVGLGTMGLGIAQVYASAGFRVLATDAHPPARDSAVPRLTASLRARVAKGALTAQAAADTLARLTVTSGLAALAPCGLVIEAIAERLDAKRALFADLEAVLAPEAVLATNTSALSVAALAQGLTHPGRVLGLHFFNPAPAMRLVELIPHPTTFIQSVSIARQATEQAGKTVVSAPDTPGFIVNRCARPYYGEALALLEEGRTAPEIDAALQAAGYRLGPFALIDLIGADINLAATEGLWAALHHHPRYHVFASLRAQVAAGRLGAKSGHGFVTTPVAPPVAPPPDAAALALRIEATLINEAAWLHATGPARADIDTAVRLGLNFPRGPFAAMQQHGPARIRATLAALEQAAPPHLRGRYTPAPALESA